MAFPRHNVRQYMGNAPWDAQVMGLGDTVRAMLGDPFAFAVSPELDVLRQLLQKPEFGAHRIASEAADKWYADERYNFFFAGEMTRRTFVNALSGGGPHGQGLSRDFVLNSSTWARLESTTIKARLQEALASGRKLSPEVATCAAVFLADAMFAQRPADDVMRDLQSDAGEEEAVAFSRPRDERNRSLWESLYAGGVSAMPNGTSDDPHDVLYTTIYPQNAHGFYGGNLTIAFAPADSPRGSGIDAEWADKVGCPMPGAEPAFCARRRNASALAAELAAFLEVQRGPNATDRYQVADMPDGGEMRTPNYKTPSEVEGVTIYEWNTVQSCVFPDPNHNHSGRDAEVGCGEAFWNQRRRLLGSSAYMPMPFDLSTLARPIDWAIERIRDDDHGSRPSMAYVLAPGKAANFAGDDGVFGVNYDSDRQVYTASPPPPFRMPDRVVSESVPVRMADLPPTTDRVVPVWGVLYACNATNLLGAYNQETPSASASTCAAAAALRPHRPETEPLYSKLADATLPDSITHILAAARVWPTDATIDLAQQSGLDGPSASRRLQVCVLSFAAAASMDRSGACDAA